jgi:hypothetical protein
VNKIILRLEEPETYSLFTAGCGLHPLYLHTTAKNIAIQSIVEIKHFIEMWMTRNVHNHIENYPSCSIFKSSV